jgi:hypothetical protein
LLDQPLKVKNAITPGTNGSAYLLTTPSRKTYAAQPVDDAGKRLLIAG